MTVANMSVGTVVLYHCDLSGMAVGSKSNRGQIVEIRKTDSRDQINLHR